MTLREEIQKLAVEAALFGASSQQVESAIHTGIKLAEAAAQGRIKELEADAQRYRWLRDKAQSLDILVKHRADEWDAALDTARAEGKA